jgi:translation initiation factor 2-alpha kinase 4
MQHLKSLNFAKTGHGGFGHVVLCQNKLDGRQYAVKKIRLKDKSLPVNDRILR